MTTSKPDIQECAEVRADLPGLDGSELSARRVTEVRSHLTGCEACGDIAASYRAMRRTLTQLHETSVTPPAGLLDLLLADAANPGVVERAAVLGRGVVSGSRPRVLAAGVGVGAMAAGGLGVLAWRALRSRRALA